MQLFVLFLAFVVGSSFAVNTFSHMPVPEASYAPVTSEPQLEMSANLSAENELMQDEFNPANPNHSQLTGYGSALLNR